MKKITKEMMICDILDSPEQKTLHLPFYFLSLKLTVQLFRCSWD